MLGKREAKRFYASRTWAVARGRALHDAGHACQQCGASLIGQGKLAQVHHRKPLRTTPALATEPLNLQALCIGCHRHAEAELLAQPMCDTSGRPLNPGHPWAIAMGGMPKKFQR